MVDKEDFPSNSRDNDAQNQNSSKDSFSALRALLIYSLDLLYIYYIMSLTLKQGAILSYYCNSA